MMSAWDSALHVWWNQAESETSLYETELLEYRETNPMPQLGEFMKGAF